MTEATAEQGKIQGWLWFKLICAGPFLQELLPLLHITKVSTKKFQRCVLQAMDKEMYLVCSKMSTGIRPNVLQDEYRVYNLCALGCAQDAPVCSKISTQRCTLHAIGWVQGNTVYREIFTLILNFTLVIIRQMYKAGHIQNNVYWYRAFIINTLNCNFFSKYLIIDAHEY